jgi:hypothetical protein
VSLVKMRGNCSFCWYLLNWWPSLFKLFIINSVWFDPTGVRTHGLSHSIWGR